jgi:hypothetical protein
MPKYGEISDSIYIKDLDGGDAYAGNGGDGYNKGDIYYKPEVNFEPEQKVYGSENDNHAGDYTKAYAEWYAKGKAGDGDEGGDGGKAFFAFKSSNGGEGGDGGNAKTNSNGDLEIWSGHNKASIDADTKAYQSNELHADQSALILAGVGGDGGHGNFAVGGNASAAALDYSKELDIDVDVPHLLDGLAPA